MEITASTHLKVKIDPLEVIEKLLGPYWIKEDEDYLILMRTDLNEHLRDIVVNASDDKIKYYYGLQLVKEYLKNQKK